MTCLPLLLPALLALVTSASVEQQVALLSSALASNATETRPITVDLWGEWALLHDTCSALAGPDAANFWVYDLNQSSCRGNTVVKFGAVSLTCHTGGPSTPELGNSQYAVLVASAQSTATKKDAVTWLQAFRSSRSLLSLGILLKGNERCTNDWLLPYLKGQSVHRIRFMFTIYGYSKGYGVGIGYPQDRLFQWPLGVAALRGFPKVTLRPALAAPEATKRKHLCNFMGTIHKHAQARIQVVRILRDPRYKHWNCFLKYRDEWTKAETDQSLAQYIETLKNTDFTLCPAGMNLESFRIYEAMSYGSVPVLVPDAHIRKGDLQDQGYKCAGSFQLLKYYSAPVIWLNEWTELPTVMEALRQEPPEDTYRRPSVKCWLSLVPLRYRCRLSVLEWYAKFKDEMARQFVSSTLLLATQP